MSWTRSRGTSGITFSSACGLTGCGGRTRYHPGNWNAFFTICLAPGAAHATPGEERVPSARPRASPAFFTVHATLSSRPAALRGTPPWQWNAFFTILTSAHKAQA